MQTKDRNEPNAGRDVSPLKDLVSYRVSRLQAKLNAQANRILKKHSDLSLMQWRVLVILDVLDASTHSEIARLTEFDKGLLSRTIKGMVDKNLITATQSKTDNRQFELTMSNSGRRQFAAALPHMRARQKKLLNALPDTELRSFFHALNNLESVTEDTDDGS